MSVPTTATAQFEAQALPHLDTLYRVALRLSGEPAQADDLVQETMLKAFRAWDRFTQGTNVRGWLLTILRNTFINEYRRSKRAPIAMDLESAEPYSIAQDTLGSDPEGRFFSQLVDARVIEAIDSLPPDFREVVLYSDVEGMNYAEIAQLVGVPVGTVKSRLFRARRQLQQTLYGYAVEQGYLGPEDRP